MHRNVTIKSTRGFTLIELLVVIAIVGILVAMLLPALQSTRGAARKMTCQNNLRQVGLATLQFEGARGAFPPARLEPALEPKPGFECGGKHPTWLVRILPFLEESATFSEWDVNATYNGHSAALRNRTISTLICPTRRTADEAIVQPNFEYQQRFSSCGCGGFVRVEIAGGATGDYGANHGDTSPGANGGAGDFYRGGNGTGVIISSRARCYLGEPKTWVDKIRHADLIDGTTKTFLAGEMHVTPDLLLTQPYDGPIFNGEDLASFARVGGLGVPLARDQFDTPGPILGFGSWHHGICHFAMADGSMQTVDNLIDSQTLARLCNRADRTIEPTE